MSAHELRRASDTLRERADQALGTDAAPWTMHDGGTYAEVLAAPSDGWKVAEYASHEAASYIATTHPGVGLALADWLDWTLTYIYGTDPIPDEHPALTVARAVFGETT